MKMKEGIIMDKKKTSSHLFENQSIVLNILYGQSKKKNRKYETY